MKDGIEQSSLCEMEIIKKIINGQSGLFEHLISKYGSLLYKIASQFGFNRQNAKDVAGHACCCLSHAGYFTRVSNSEFIKITNLFQH